MGLFDKFKKPQPAETFSLPAEVSSPPNSIFEGMDYDDYDGYKKKIMLVLDSKKTEVELILSEVLGEGGIEKGHHEAYKALMSDWNAIITQVLGAILTYQNEQWDATDHTQSFPKFETVEDVLANVNFVQLKIHAQAPPYQVQGGRYVIFCFEAEWVNDDYRLLSVALINEAVIEVTDQSI